MRRNIQFRNFNKIRITYKLQIGNIRMIVKIGKKLILINEMEFELLERTSTLIVSRSLHY